MTLPFLPAKPKPSIIGQIPGVAILLCFFNNFKAYSQRFPHYDRLFFLKVSLELPPSSVVPPTDGRFSLIIVLLLPLLLAHCPSLLREIKNAREGTRITSNRDATSDRQSYNIASKAHHEKETETETAGAGRQQERNGAERSGTEKHTEKRERAVSLTPPPPYVAPDIHAVCKSGNCTAQGLGASLGAAGELVAAQ